LEALEALEALEGESPNLIEQRATERMQRREREKEEANRRPPSGSGPGGSSPGGSGAWRVPTGANEHERNCAECYFLAVGAPALKIQSPASFAFCCLLFILWLLR
jgi:hypothetical protein